MFVFLYLHLVAACSYVVCQQPPGYMRDQYDTTHTSTFGIFHNLPEIFNVLQDVPELMDIPQVQELHEKMKNNQLVQWPRETAEGAPDRRPFIVIEGIKGSGKSATARLFTQKLNGTYLRSPPDYLAGIRGLMSMKPRLVRSAYHSLNNYLMAELVKSIVKTRLVVMDQYWHGLTAFALAKLAGIRQNLPIPGSPIYNFPTDLLVPDLSFYIAANDERRLFKLPDTGKPATSRIFRESTYEAYSLMDLPKMIAINGDRAREEVESEMVQIARERLQGFI
ncbi:UMP kinase activity protein [Homalodisca vitripennis]|nr:UMP kinase activity protein [Homalodisca vitripennis]